MTKQPPLPTPLVFDACLRLGLPPRLLPVQIRPLVAGSRVQGRALPARHCGSVDVFLEAMAVGESAGRVLVVENDGRPDEGCVGDLVVLEAVHNGVAGIVIDGRHRDTAELMEIGLPIFSYGACLAGPVRLDPRPVDAIERARLGEVEIDGNDWLFADDNGVIVVAGAEVENVLEAGRAIHEVERRQASQVRDGRSLREQLRFDDYLARRSSEPVLTFRRHLREIGGAIEE